MATVDDAAGTTLGVRTVDAASGRFTQHVYRYPLSSKLRVQSISLYPSNPLDRRSTAAAVALGDATVTLVADTAFPVGATSPAPPIRIPVSSDARTLDVACDGRTAVVAGTDGAVPVSLVDLVARQEVATVAYAGKLARSVAVDDQGTQALVVIDDKGASTGGTIRRLRISSGTLIDAGESLGFGAEYIARAYFAADAKFGFALVGDGPARLVSFSVPGLVPKSAVSLAGGAGNAVAVSPDGTRVYVRSGQRSAHDVVEAFGFDPATGAIAQPRVYRVDSVGGFTGTVSSTSMGITEDGRYLVAADEDVAGTPSTPRLVAIEAATGAHVESLLLAADTRPTIAATRRACKSTAIQTAVEYYHAAFDHYFATSIADEVAMLDDGAFAGWRRTGEQFNVYANGVAGAEPACRFFGPSFGTRSSHFYATSASECAAVKANPSWQFEGEVFATHAPAADGTCAAAAVPLYRLYNGGKGGAPSHRYTTQTDVRTQMIGQGWMAEGLGIGVVACVPP